MNFFDSEFARFARATIRRRRGWSLLGVVVACWVVIVAVGYGLFIAIRHVAGA